MAKVINKYNNPTVTHWEVNDKGEKISVKVLNETFHVVDGKYSLIGFPDERYRVYIDNMVEIDIDEEIKQENQFKVDYRSTGVVFFHENLEGKKLTINRYHSKGVVYYPASRVWTKVDEWGNVTETLESVAKEVEVIYDVVSRVDDILKEGNKVDKKLKETIVKSELSKSALDKSIASADTENKNLQGTIKDSVVKNTTLSNTVKDSVSKDNVLKATIKDSIGKNSTLNATITDSVAKDKELKGTITQSENKETILQGTIADSITKDTALKNTITESLAKDKVLKGTIADSLAKDKLLKDTTAQGDLQEKKLSETIIVSDDKNKVLQSTIKGSETANSTLGNTIKDSVAKNTTLANTIKDSINKDTLLKGTITDSIAKDKLLKETIAKALADNTNLSKVITDSGVKKKELEGVITKAIAENKTLNLSITEGKQVENKLKEIISGTDFSNIITDIEELKKKADKKDIPTKVSQLTNDSKYLVKSGTIDNAKSLASTDTRSVKDTPLDIMKQADRGIIADFKYRTSVGNPPVEISASSTYAHIVSIGLWSDKSGGYPVQYSTGGKNLGFRQGISDTEWGEWQVLTTQSDLQKALNDGLSKKADKTTMTTELNKKANTTTMNTELGKKADKVYVDKEIDILKQSVSSGKSKVAKAITDKGVSSNATSSFDVLATNISKIETDKTGDATMVATDLLAGKTGYAKGNKITGKMINFGEVVKTITTQNGHIVYPEGYADGIFIKANFPNLKPENVVKGVNIGGVIGNATKLDDKILNPSERIFGYYRKDDTILTEIPFTHDLTPNQSFSLEVGSMYASAGRWNGTTDALAVCTMYLEGMKDGKKSKLKMLETRASAYSNSAAGHFVSKSYEDVSIHVFPNVMIMHSTERDVEFKKVDLDSYNISWRCTR